MTNVTRIFRTLVICSAIWACNAQAWDSAPKENENPKSVKDQVCYPEVLTQEDRDIGMAVPCAPKNYVHAPLTETQKNVEHDKSGIWQDSELTGVTEPGIWEKTVKVGSTEVTLSMLSALGVCSPSSCPLKVRLKETGKPEIIKEIGYVCGSDSYFFVRDDLKDLMACDEHYALN